MRYFLAFWLTFGLALPSGLLAEKPAKYSFGNGLRVGLVPSPGDKQAVVLLGVRAGFMEEPAGVPHVAHVADHPRVFELPITTCRKTPKRRSEIPSNRSLAITLLQNPRIRNEDDQKRWGPGKLWMAIFARSSIWRPRSPP